MNAGLFLSTCKGLVSQSVDLKALSGHYKDLAAVEVVDDFYDPISMSTMLRLVEEKHLDAVVLAGESPMAYKEMRNGDDLFRCLRERGVNANRIEVVNLKNMVVRPHKATPQALQTKAEVLIDVGLEKVKQSSEMGTVEVSPRKAVAIVGGHAMSYVLAQHLLDAGHKVFLLNRDTKVTIPDGALPHVLPTMTYAARHERFHQYDDAVATDFFGFTGDYALGVKVAGKDLELQVGAVALAPESNPSVVKELQALFHIDVDDSGRLAAKDEATARSQTLDRGVFVINPPRAATDDLAASMLAADATGAMIMSLLSRQEIQHQVAISQVKRELCGGCGVCVKTCIFHAVTLEGEPRVSHIERRRCRGCGNCVTACPASARELVSMPSGYLSKAVEIMARYAPAGGGKKVLFVGCEGCGYSCLDRAAEAGLTWPVTVMPLRVVCGGQIDMQLILHALVQGFDGVVLGICGEGCCHNLIGNVDLERRVNLLREVLTSRGLDAERVHIVATCARTASGCVESINSFMQRLEAPAGSASGQAAPRLTVRMTS